MLIIMVVWLGNYINNSKILLQVMYLIVEQSCCSRLDYNTLARKHNKEYSHK